MQIKPTDSKVDAEDFPVYQKSPEIITPTNDYQNTTENPQQYETTPI